MNQAAAAIGCAARGRARPVSPGLRLLPAALGRVRLPVPHPPRVWTRGHRGNAWGSSLAPCQRETLRPGFVQLSLSPECPNLCPFSRHCPPFQMCHPAGRLCAPRLLAVNSRPALRHPFLSVWRAPAARSAPPRTALPCPGSLSSRTVQRGADAPTRENLFHSRSPRVTAAC